MDDILLSMTAETAKYCSKLSVQAVQVRTESVYSCFAPSCIWPA